MLIILVLLFLLLLVVRVVRWGVVLVGVLLLGSLVLGQVELSWSDRVKGAGSCSSVKSIAGDLWELSSVECVGKAVRGEFVSFCDDGFVNKSGGFVYSFRVSNHYLVGVEGNVISFWNVTHAYKDDLGVLCVA